MPGETSTDLQTTDRLPVLRRALLTAYTVALVWSIFVWGIPIDRLLVLTWMGVAFGLGTVGRSFADVKQALRDWTALVAIYIAYDYSRGMADQLGMKVSYVLPSIDRFLFLGRDPNVFMQWHFMKPDVRWWDVAGSVVYMTHFVLPVVPLALLRVRNRVQWQQYLRRFALTLYVSVAVFVVFPTAPPWMAARDGYMDSIVRGTGRGWWELHLKTVSKTIDRGAAVMNPVAAFPSLHAGCALLVTLWLCRNKSWKVRSIALAYPVAMILALVYFGEHYFVDAAAGWLVVLLAWWIADTWEERRGYESPAFSVRNALARLTSRSRTA